MLPDIRHLRAFLAVAEDLSFRTAAERLGIAQPSLSRTIKDLETFIGVKLVERTTRRVSLTKAGNDFFGSASRLLIDLENAIVRAQQTQARWAGEVSVGYNDFAINGLLPVIVQRFHSQYPMAKVHLSMVQSREMVRRVEEGELDAAFHLGIEGMSLEHSLLVRDERLVALVPKDHPLASHRSLRIADLKDQPFVMGRHDTWTQFLEIIEAFCKSEGFDMDVVQEAQHSDGIVALVGVGLGVSIYIDSDWLHKLNEVCVVPIVGETPKVETVLTWRKTSGQHRAALENFISVAHEVVREYGPVL